MTNPVIDNINSNLTKIAANDALKGFLPAIDTFLSNIAGNQAGLVGDAADVKQLEGNVVAAGPQVGAQVVKDEAGSLKTTVDAAAAKAETSTAPAAGQAGPVTTGG